MPESILGKRISAGAQKPANKFWRSARRCAEQGRLSIEVNGVDVCACPKKDFGCMRVALCRVVQWSLPVPVLNGHRCARLKQNLDEAGVSLCGKMQWRCGQIILGIGSCAGSEQQYGDGDAPLLCGEVERCPFVLS
jgi:hypothetical protein